MKKVVRKVKDFFKKLWNKLFRKGKDNPSGGGGKPPAQKDAPAISGSTQWWYGRVNYWAENSDTLKREVQLMASAGVTGYIIEMAGWGGNDMRQKPGSSHYNNFVAKCKSYYKYLHKLCLENGMWLFCCIVNDNALSNKHGNKAVDPRHYYDHVASDLLDIVLADGPRNVIVQPVSELSRDRVKNHPGPAWQKKAVSKLKSAGFKTCNNDGYGRPSGPGACNYVAWHPNSIGSLPSMSAPKSKTFIVSDTGGIISELNGGASCDKVDANCKPSKIAEWRRKCKGYAVCGYYDFKRKSFNEAAIKAMGGK